MAGFSASGFAELGLTLEQIAVIPPEVQDEMLRAEARVIAEAQKAKGRAYGVYLTGVTLASIKPTAVKTGKNGRYVDVMAQGTNKQGRPNAEVAFVNEYGARGTAPRPFQRDANEEAGPRAFEAALRVYDQWLDSKK